MKIYEQSIIDLVTRAKKRPNENLALIGERYQAVREVHWPAIRWHAVQLSITRPYHTVKNSEMSLAFENGSRLRCFSADRLDQMEDLRFTATLVLPKITESDLISLRKAGIIPPSYVPLTGDLPTILPRAVLHDPKEAQ